MHPIKSLIEGFFNSVEMFFRQHEIPVTSAEPSLSDIVLDMQLEDKTLKRLGVYGYIKCTGEETLEVTIKRGFDRKAMSSFLRESLQRDLIISYRIMTL